MHNIRSDRTSLNVDNVDSKVYHSRRVSCAYKRQREVTRRLGTAFVKQQRQQPTQTERETASVGHDEYDA